MMASLVGFDVLNMHCAQQVQNEYDQQNGAEDAKAAASSPPGITVIAATSAEQQDQYDDKQ
jgi:hypothetical protein